MNGEFRSLLIAAKANVQEEAQGFGNGHSGYMVVGVDRDEFLDDITLRYREELWGADAPENDYQRQEYCS